MAIAQLQLPSYQINNTVDQAQWNTLGNLGNVYSEAQAAAAKRAALSSLGDDPQANLHTLLSSGDPALAQLGLNLQQKGIDRQTEAERAKVADAHWAKQYAIQAAAASRAAKDWEEAGVDKAAIPGLVASGQVPPQRAAPPSPFPALSGLSSQATVPPIPQTQTPSYIPPPQATMPPPQATAPPPQAPPNAFEATPRLPTEFQPPAPPVTPPVKAEDTNLPEWAQSAQAAPPSLVDRGVNALTSGTSPAAAGFSRETIGKMIQNPLTRQMGISLLEAQTSPGKWTYIEKGGKLIAVNDRDPSNAKVVMDLPQASDYAIEKQEAPDGSTQLVRVKKQGPEGPINAGGAATASSVDPSLTGEDFLAALDPGRASQVKAIAEGRQPPPSSYAMKSPQVRAMMRDVAQYEPGFDLSLWKSRNDTQTDLAKGKMGQAITSFNTVLKHLGNLDIHGQALENSAYPSWNAWANAAREQYDPKFAASLKNFNVDKIAAVDELTRAFRLTGGNVHDIKSWEKVINSADSPEAMRAAVTEAVDLLKGRMEGVGDQYKRGMRTTAKADSVDLLTPAAKTTLQRLSGDTNPADAVLVKAKTAISQGADPAIVRQRLMKAGYDPGDIGK
jgi:hypothetical protein